MFRKAQRKAAKLRLALIGPSGAGKTYSALMIAKGLGGPVALIDTERGSGELYSHVMDYDVAQISPPFNPEKYINTIVEAEKAGYEILIIDSLSHAWSGEGGILDIQDRAAKSVRNSFAAWREVTPLHNALVDKILASTCHLIVTMRTKTAYEVSTEDGKSKVTKVGLAPIQRDGVEYEFSLVLDLSIEGHIATASKDRTGLFDGDHFPPSEDTGKVLKEWLVGGNAGLDQPHPPNPVTFSGNASVLMNQVITALDELGLVTYLNNYNQYVSRRYGTEDMESLSRDQLIEQLTLLRQCKERPKRLEELKGILNQQQKAA